MYELKYVFYEYLKLNLALQVLLMYNLNINTCITRVCFTRIHRITSIKKGGEVMELNKEILKGHIDTLILAILEKNDSYGFEIAKNVFEQTTFELKDGTLYISLKRLESKGLVESYWQSSKGPGNRRKYYKITEEGVKNLELKVQEWVFVKNIMDKYLEGRYTNENNR